ncbi:MAG: leucine-rich repeat protein [Clostridia bacterium]|nr:leucine-rich repeat protein [Clostridia bacterium]
MKNKTNRTLRKILSIALCLALVMSYVPMVSITAGAAVSDITATIDTGASVTLRDADGDDYYDIGTADELYAFAAAINLGKYDINGELTADIVVNENVLTETGELNGDGSDFRVWPRTGYSFYYSGIFNGQNHTVSGLYFNDSSASAIGFFSNVNKAGTVQNVGVIDSYFNGNGTIGGVVGRNHGTLENCYSDTTVSGDHQSIGGVVGANDNGGTVRNCHSVGNVKTTASYVGGVVGYNKTDCTVENCSNTGTVNNDGFYAGGVAGYNYGIVQNCCNTGSVSLTKRYAGGVVGRNYGTVKNCYNTGSVSVTGEYVGGVVGRNYETVTDCYYLSGCATDGNNVTQFGIGNATVGETTADEAGKTIAMNSDQLASGEVCTNLGKHIGLDAANGFCCLCTYQPSELNEDNYYEISNAGQLFWFANYINTVDRTANAVLTADIDLEGRPWTPIGSTGENSHNFRGIFDGQNHTIKGLYVEGGRAGLGFFGEVRTGTVKNFTIYGEVVANTDVNYVGGVIGSACGLNGDNDLERNGAIIQNITSYVNLTAKTHGIGMIGGFVGYANHESLIENCSWYGTFDAGEYRVDSGAGGFIGKIQENTSRVTIRNCGAYGTIKTNYAKNSYNNTPTIYMGGFLSFSNTGAQTSIENCLFAGKFECGANLTDEARLGAFGTLRGVNAIKNCYHLGDDGLEAVHSDSSLKPGENIEITSVTREQLKSGEVAYLLGEAWGQVSNTEGSLPIITDNELYKVVTVGETGNYSVANVGDTNGDGTVDVNDYQVLVNAILNEDPEQEAVKQIETASYDDIVKYDLDGDGYLDVIDAYLLHLFINGFTTVDVYAVGDYNLNGKAFEEADIKAIKHAIENPEKLATYKKYASDINGDGKLDENDLTALTSKYGEVTGTECADNVEVYYSWGNKYSTCTATAMCTLCGKKVATETVNTTSETLSESTCTQDGKVKYIAIFENELFEEKIKTVTTDMLPHNLSDGVCTVCGIIDATAMSAEDLNVAVSTALSAGHTDIEVGLAPDAPAGMITAIRRAICDTDGVADGSIHLTLKGVTSIPGTTNWDGVAFGPGDIYDEAGEIVDQELVTQLASINLPDVTEIGAQAFYFCENLVTVSAPKAKTIGAQAFGYTALTSVEFPELTTIPTDMFSGTWTLSSAKFPKVTTIEQGGLLVGGKFKPENNPTPFPLELTAEGDITFNGSYHFNIAERNYTGKVDLVLCCDKKDAVTFQEDGTATWQVREDLSYTFKSITFKHSYVDGKCEPCGEDCAHTGEATYTLTEDGKQHIAKWSCCDKEVTEDHTGGTATCKEPAKCEHCDASYGELDPNNHEYEKNNGICCETYQPAELNESGYYEIGNAGQLFWFAQQVNVEGNKEIKGALTADIDLENKPWTPIGAMGEENSFRGVFDGQNYTIRGLNVEGSENGVGFFGEVRTGTVKNFTIYGEVIVNAEVDYVGGVSGSICGLDSENDLERNGAVIQNITSYVNVTANAHGIGMIGGFVGYADHQSLIEKCSWYGTFDAGEYRVDDGAGGFIGKIQGNTSEVTIRNCAAYGTIKTDYVKNSYNNTATIYMGGFLSFSNTGAKTTLENCLFAGRFERGANLTDEARLGAFGTLRSVKAIKNCYYLGDDGLAAVHSDSDLKPGSDNVEITSVTEDDLRNNTIATQLGDFWAQGENYPVIKR